MKSTRLLADIIIFIAIINKVINSAPNKVQYLTCKWMSRQTPEALGSQVLLCAAHWLCCLGIGSRIQAYPSDVSAKISFAGTLKSRCSTHLLMHKQQALHLNKKITKERAMPSPAGTFLKPSPCLHAWIPALCLQGRAARLFTPSSSAHSHTLLPAACCYLYSGTVLNITAPFSLAWPCSLSFTTIEPEGGNTTPLKIGLKTAFLCFVLLCVFYLFSYLSTERLLCVL